MNIFIPLRLNKNVTASFSETSQNPGIGGTEFTSIKLALMLARKYPELSITLISTHPICLNNAYSNLDNTVVKDLADFFEKCNTESEQFLILCTMVIASEVRQEVLCKLADKIVIWLHHPFHFVPEVKKLGCVAHVHVGEYQYYSNKTFYPASWYIQNPFKTFGIGSPKILPESCSVIKIIYLGALFRSKGFGHIASQWASIKNILPNAQLHVIGSSATYGEQPEDHVIPCDSDFATEILSHIPLSDIENGKVIFHGNLGEEKFELIRSAHFAILNPTGTSEAFPASPLECMACGLPIIASDDYGMSDSMRFFPELILQTPEDIPARVSFLMADHYRYEELSARSIAVAWWFDSQTDVILSRWRRLFDLASRHDLGIPDSPPYSFVYGPRSKLLIRQIRARLGLIKRSILVRLGTHSI